MIRHMIPKRIRSIDFALIGPKEIRNLSTTKVITADTYDDDGFPIQMGLMDMHLGVIEPGLRCKTCSRKLDGRRAPGFARGGAEPHLPRAARRQAHPAVGGHQPGGG